MISINFSVLILNVNLVIIVSQWKKTLTGKAKITTEQKKASKISYKNVDDTHLEKNALLEKHLTKGKKD